MASLTPTAPKVATEQAPLLGNRHTDSSLEAYDRVNDAPVETLRRSRFTKGEIIRYSLFSLFAVVVTVTIVDAIIRTPDVKVIPNFLVSSL